MHKHSHIHKTRQSRPAGLSSLSDKMQFPLPALELTRKKPLSLLLSLDHRPGSKADANNCGLVGSNRSDIVRKSLMAPNHLSNIVIFWFLQMCECYESLPSWKSICRSILSNLPAFASTSPLLEVHDQLSSLLSYQPGRAELGYRHSFGLWQAPEIGSENP